MKSNNNNQTPMVTLEDGSEVSMNELKECYRLREKCAAWARELDTADRELQQMNNNYEQRMELLKLQYERLREFLDKLIGEEPDENLAKTDPVEYRKVSFARNVAIREFNTLMDSAAADQKNAAELRRQGMRQLMDSHERMLLEMFPPLRDPEKRSEFDDFMNAAKSHFGYGREELISTNDHKFMQVLYYAMQGYRSARDDKHLH